MPRPFFLFIIWIAFRAHCGPSVSMAVDWCWERSSNAVCLDEKDGHDACAVNWLTTERKRIQQKRKGKKKTKSARLRYWYQALTVGGGQWTAHEFQENSGRTGELCGETARDTSRALACIETGSGDWHDCVDTIARWWRYKNEMTSRYRDTNTYERCFCSTLFLICCVHI